MPPKKRAKYSKDPESGSDSQARTGLEGTSGGSGETGTERWLLQSENEYAKRMITCSAKLHVETRSHNQAPSKFIQEFKLDSAKPFEVKPVLITEGPLKGRHVIVLEPEVTSKDKFPFLELPAEIRNMIYSYVFRRSGRVIYLNRCVLYSRAWLHNPDRSKVWGGGLSRHFRYASLIDPRRLPNGDTSTIPSDFDLAFAHCNRQIHAESTPFLYSQQKFEFANSPALVSFLWTIGPNKAQFLTSVKVNRTIRGETVKDLLHLAPGMWLQSLDLYGNDTAYIVGTFLRILKAMCEAGRDREEALGIISWDGRPKSSSPFKNKQDIVDEVRRRLIIVEEKERKKQEKKERKKKREERKLAKTQTRAGRQIKAVDYSLSDDDDDDDGY